MKKFELDMTKGSIFKNIILFSIPFMLTSVLQLLYNAADLIVVSRFTGSNAMASVGATASITNLILNISMGLATGGGVVVARKFGQKDNSGMHRAVHTILLLGMIIGLATCIIGFVFSRPLLVITGAPEGAILDGATLYMRIIFLGTPASVLYNFGAAVLRATGDTRRPLYILASTGIVNVILNIILVIVFHMGVAGVAIGTIAANYISAIAIIIIFARSDASYKLHFKKLKFYRSEVLNIIKIGLPAGIQGSLFSLANISIQSAVNSFGAAAIAGSAAGLNIESFMYVVMNTFYQATITAVGQNLGAGDTKRINKSISASLLYVVVAALILGVLCTTFARQLLGIYIADSPEAVGFGIERMKIVCIFYFLIGIMEVLTGALRGLGYSTISTINSFFGACGLRIFWVFFILPLNRSMGFLFLCMPISWMAVCIMHCVTLTIVKPRVFKKMKTTN